MPLAALDRERHRRIGLDRADAVDARHRGDDDHVVALQQRARRGVAHAVDLLVDRGFLLDIGVGARDVGFRLVVVVIGDEILDRVVGKEAPELAIELRRQRLVGREDEGRALRRLDHLGHGEGLARAGDAEQHLAAVVALARLRPGRRSPVGWSPLGSNSDLMTRRRPPSDFSGRGGRCGVQILAGAVLLAKIPAGLRAAISPAPACWRRRRASPAAAKGGGASRVAARKSRRSRRAPRRGCPISGLLGSLSS